METETERAYQAFEVFLSLPSNDRTVIGAYRSHVGNPEAHRVSDTWAKWSRDFAWAERASAYDAYLESLRREAYERAIQDQAAQQAREIEKIRYRYNELMTLAYVQAAEWLENAQPSDLRAQDVLKIIGLHLDGVKAFGVEESRADDDWTEEDEAAFDEIVKKVEALRDQERPDGEEGEGDDSENTESDLI